MAQVYFISHPEVVVDFSKKVESWDLSQKGLERLENARLMRKKEL
jgi:hypothetical protein